MIDPILDALLWYADTQGITNPTIGTAKVGIQWVITNWNCGGLPQPNESQIETIVGDYNTQQKAIDEFDANIAVGRINEVFTGATAVALMPYLSTIQNLMVWKNFPELKIRLEDMRVAQVISDQSILLLKSILAEQGIDIDTF